MFKAAAQGKVLNKAPAGKRFWMLKYVCYTDVASGLGGCRCCTTAESHCGRKVFKGKKHTKPSTG